MQGQPQQFHRGRCSCRSARPPARSAVAANSRTAGQEVGQLAAVELRSGGAVPGLERGERGAAAAGLAVGPPGEVQAAAAAGVEHLDVVLRRPAGRGGRDGVEERRAVPGAARRQRVDRVADDRHQREQRGVGVAQAHRRRLQHDGLLARAGQGRRSPRASPPVAVAARWEQAVGAALAVPVEEVDPRAGSAGVGIWSLVCRSRRAWKVSTDTASAARCLAERAAAGMPGPPVDVEAAAQLLELVGLTASRRWG